MQHNSPRRRRKDHHHDSGGGHTELAHDESNWLVSYADMMTLLFGFFVLMYSFSKIDEDKFEVVRKDLVKYFGGKMKESPGTTNLKKSLESQIAAAASEVGFKEQIDVSISANMVQLSFDSQLVFSPGSAELTAQSAQIIDKVANEVKKFNVQEIKVEGHSDIDQIHSAFFPSNWELSTARAARIIRRLSENGLSEDKMMAVGYSSSRPIAPHKTEDGKVIDENKAKNRRVVMSISLKPDGSLSLSEIEKVGFKTIPNEQIETEEDKIKKEYANKNEELKVKLQEAQKRYQEVNAKLKEAQELEKSMREMETISKKTAELEKKVQSITEKNLNVEQPRRDPTGTQPSPNNSGSAGEHKQ